MGDLLHGHGIKSQYKFLFPHFSLLLIIIDRITCMKTSLRFTFMRIKSYAPLHTILLHIQYIFMRLPTYTFNAVLYQPTNQPTKQPPSHPPTHQPIFRLHTYTHELAQSLYKQTFTYLYDTRTYTYLCLLIDKFTCTYGISRVKGVCVFTRRNRSGLTMPLSRLSIQGRAHTQLVGEHSATVVSAR